MSREPDVKRAFAFIDASDMEAAAARAFGAPFAGFNPVALAQEVAAARGWKLIGIGCYIGVPDAGTDEKAHEAEIGRCARWRKQGIRIFTRTLLPDETGAAREKGLRLRMALDAVGLFREGAYDVALLFSQDQDFSELAAELKTLARAGKRRVDIASAFPSGANASSPAGIGGALPIPLDEAFFRTVGDTPENRRRVHAPLIAPQPRARGATARQGMQNAGAQSRAAATAPLAPAHGMAKRSVFRAAGFVLGTYLAAATATFGYLTWAERAALTGAATAVPALAQHARAAAIWPAYWLSAAHGEAGARIASRGR